MNCNNSQIFVEIYNNGSDLENKQFSVGFVMRTIHTTDYPSGLTHREENR